MTEGAVALAQGVLDADGDPFRTLSLAPSMPAVTADTALTDARRNYMRLAAAIHPDKIKSSFDKATEAFQCLVRAFESFADPATRARLGRRAETKAKTRTSRRRAAGAKASQKAASKTRAGKTNRKATKAASASADDEEDFVEHDEADEEDEESEEDTASWEEEFLASDVPPTVSTSRTPIGQPRVGGVYVPTIIGCPHCRTPWEPDAKPQYSLFMGKWGKKVHCQLCLFVFGSATALHSCPHCESPIEYDSSMYDRTIHCQGCKRELGFPYYPVNQMLIDQLALEAWREQKDAARAKEREQRARARHRDTGAGRTSAAEERMMTLVGTCVVEDECPLCHKRVKKNHRSHVEECLARQGGGSPGATRRDAEETAKRARPVAAVRRGAGTRKATTGKARTGGTKSGRASAPARQARRRRRDEDSDDDDESSAEEDDDDDDEDDDESEAESDTDESDE